MVLKRKSFTRTYTESIFGHALVLRWRVLNSFFLLLYFFCPSVLSLFVSFLVRFSPPLSLFFSLYYILWPFYHFLLPRVDQVVEVLFFCFSCLFLNLSFLAVRLRVHCPGITSTLMRPKG